MSKQYLTECLLAALSAGALWYCCTHDLSGVPSYSGARSEAKSYETLDAFYPFYLSQHSTEGCRAMHLVGTTLALAFVALLNVATLHKTVAWVCLSMSVGCVVHQMTIGEATGAVEALAILATALVTTSVLDVPASQPLIVALLGYSAAWFGHFHFEKNTPATFVYPTWSFLSDARLYISMVQGKTSFSFTQ